MSVDRSRAVPEFWDNFRRSGRVRKMKDYQRYWYHALCMESHFTDRPGYLPNDMDLLYELSDCSANRKFFDNNFDCVRECFEATEDGRWLSNTKALEIATDAGVKSKKAAIAGSFAKRTLSIALSSKPVLSIYEDYKPKIGRSKALKAIEKAIDRLSQQESISDVDAAQIIHEAVLIWSASDASRPNGLFDSYTPPHPASWFNSERYLDDQSTWTKRNSNGAGGKAVSKQEERRANNRSAITDGFGAHLGAMAGHGSKPLQVRSDGTREPVVGRDTLPLLPGGD